MLLQKWSEGSSRATYKLGVTDMPSITMQRVWRLREKYAIQTVKEKVGSLYVQAKEDFQSSETVHKI